MRFVIDSNCEKNNGTFALKFPSFFHTVKFTGNWLVGYLRWTKFSEN